LLQLTCLQLQFNTYDDTVTVLGYDGYQPGPKWFVQSDNEIVHEHSQAYEQFYREFHSIFAFLLPFPDRHDQKLGGNFLPLTQFYV
jgi:hypothetical protein